MTEPGSSAATASPAAHTENRPNPAIRSAHTREDGFNSARGEPNNNSTHSHTGLKYLGGKEREKKKEKKKALKLVLRVNLHCILLHVHTSLASG